MSNLSGKSWRKALLPPGADLQQAIQTLDRAAIRIALVVGPDGVLVGTITDGDVRRGLLRGLDLTSPIESVIHREPFVVPPGLGRETVLHLMQVNKVLQLPVVDAGNRLVGVHLWEDLGESADRPNLMVIMAGGKGTRLGEHTAHCPKPMLPVDGKPMLEHIIERARSEGFRRFVLALHHLGGIIEDHFENGRDWDVRIDYLREETPLGTAGALALLRTRPDQPFLVSNADVLSEVRYGALLDFHCRHSACATMAVRQHEWQSPFGVVKTQGLEIIGFEEKPVTRNLVNAGIYALDPSALGMMERVEYCDMPTLFERLREHGRKTLAFPMHEPWVDVGRPEDLSKVRADVSRAPR